MEFDQFIGLVGLLLTLAAFFGYVNSRWLRLPMTIGMMLLGLALSLVLIVLGLFFPAVQQTAETVLEQIDFNETLMHGMLAYLLFAGALHVKIEDLAKQKLFISIVATVGIVVSTLLIGFASHWIFGLVGINLPLIYCMLFGALISPTDPISVLGIMKQVGAPKRLETKITGESLFNDGVGVVIFLGILEIATGKHEFSLEHLSMLFLHEAVGGAVFGLAIGLVAYYMLKTIEDHKTEILITVAVVAGGYPLAMYFHLSGPIAMVVAGLLLGNQGRQKAMEYQARKDLDLFWELIDEILNAVLFVLIGLEMIVLTLSGQYLLAGGLLIPTVLLARFISVGGPVLALRKMRSFSPHVMKILTWGGLRGGISIALALSLPKGLGADSGTDVRELLVTATYVVVVFSIVVQGLTIGRLIQWSIRGTPAEETPEVSEQ